MNTTLKQAVLAVLGLALMTGSASAQFGGFKPPKLPEIKPPLKNTPFDPGTWRIPENQRPQFHGDAPPRSSVVGRGAFHYSGGVFVSQGNGRWVERRHNGPPSYFAENTRNSNFVELYDSSRNLYVRLHSNVALFQDNNSRQWTRWPGSEGSWR